jgi:signal transduction histidine kinase
VLRERGTEDLYFRSASGDQSEHVKRLRVPMGHGIVGWVAAQRAPLIVNDPRTEPRFAGEIAERIGHAPRNLLAVPLVGAEGEVLGALELLDKTEARGFQIVSGVLHDLKTPMTIVSGYAQLMAQMDDANQRGQYVEQILKQFDQMAAMTREVLAFARGESNVLIRKVFVHRFIEEMASQLRHEFAGKEIKLDVDAQYKGAAWFDEQKIMRVIHNLARNAGQAMPDGGTFRMGTRTDDGKLLLEFADTGVGIPAEMEGRLFELFATSGKKDGTGLGLAIVKKIVDEHQGTITYASAPGKGTTFRIWLALDKPATIADESKDESSPG